MVLLSIVVFSAVSAGAVEITRDSKISSQFECLYKFTALKQAEDNDAGSDVVGSLRDSYRRELSSYNSIQKAYYGCSTPNFDTSCVTIENKNRGNSSSEVILHVGPKPPKELSLKKICMAYVLNLVLGYYDQNESMETTLDNIRWVDPKSDQRDVIIEYLGERSIGVLVKNDASIEELKEFIDAKNPLICYVSVRHISHWVLVVGYSLAEDDSVSAVFVRDAFWGKKKEYKIPVEIFLRIWKNPQASKKISLEAKEKCSNYMIATFGTHVDTDESGVVPPPPPPPGNGDDDSSAVGVNDPPAQNNDTAEAQASSTLIQTRLEILKNITELIKKLLDLQASLLSATAAVNGGNDAGAVATQSSAQGTGTENSSDVSQPAQTDSNNAGMRPPVPPEKKGGERNWFGSFRHFGGR